MYWITEVVRLSTGSFRTRLALKLAGVFKWYSQDFFHNKLSNCHSRGKHEPSWAKVDYFQGERPLPARMDCWGSKVNQNATSGPAAFSFNPGRQASGALGIDGQT